MKNNIVIIATTLFILSGCSDDINTTPEFDPLTQIPGRWVVPNSSECLYFRKDGLVLCERRFERNIYYGSRDIFPYTITNGIL